jgi:hypothetical protein
MDILMLIIMVLALLVVFVELPVPISIAPGTVTKQLFMPCFQRVSIRVLLTTPLLAKMDLELVSMEAK